MNEQIVSLIKDHLADAKVEVVDLTGGKDHMGITVVSDAFENHTLIEQHQMIMDILKERLANDLHAVQIKTMTHAKAEQKGVQL